MLTLYPVARMFWSTGTVFSLLKFSCNLLLFFSCHAYTSSRAQTRTRASHTHASSHGSILSRPSAHSRCAISSFSVCDKLRNQFGFSNMLSTSGFTHDQSALLKDGLSCRCER